MKTRKLFASKLCSQIIGAYLLLLLEGVGVAMAAEVGVAMVTGAEAALVTEAGVATVMRARVAVETGARFFFLLRAETTKDPPQPPQLTSWEGGRREGQEGGVKEEEGGESEDIQTVVCVHMYMCFVCTSVLFVSCMYLDGGMRGGGWLLTSLFIFYYLYSWASML